VDGLKEKSAAVFAVRRANYTHRRKGVFNGKSIEHLPARSNVRYRTDPIAKTTLKNDKHLLFHSAFAVCVKIPISL
jgi:hypothetical protein